MADEVYPDIGTVRCAIEALRKRGMTPVGVRMTEETKEGFEESLGGRVSFGGVEGLPVLVDSEVPDGSFRVDCMDGLFAVVRPNNGEENPDKEVDKLEFDPTEIPCETHEAGVGEPCSPGESNKNWAVCCSERLQAYVEGRR